MLLPRHCTTLSIPLLALPLSCTGDGPNDDEVGDTETGDGDGDTETGDGDGDGGLCTEPGTLVPDFDPFGPSESDPLPTCSTGWASTAPLQEAKWVTMIPTEAYGYYSNPSIVKGLSGGAALLISEQTLQWFDGQGAAGSEVDHGFTGFPGVRSSAVVVREADDHVFIAGSLDGDLVIREFADGALVSELMVPTPGEGSAVAGLFEFSTDEWLIAGDEYDSVEFNSEAFFMRVDGTGTQVLRKATSLGYSYYYNPSIAFAGFDGDDNLLFGSTSQQWIVDPNDGAVINPSVGLAGVRDLVGSAAGSGFVTATAQSNVSQDAVASLINGFGTNQWTQVYDRALTGEFFFDVDARPDGGFVAGGIDGIWWQAQPYQDASQPLILAFDGQGNAEWIGRLAIPGSTRSVDVASDGGIVAAGTSRMGGTDYNDIDAFIWLASW